MVGYLRWFIGSQGSGSVRWCVRVFVAWVSGRVGLVVFGSLIGFGFG